MSYQATKENPHPLDCWDRALPDESRFALLARDPLFTPLVMLWAALRCRDFVAAATWFGRLVYVAHSMPAKKNDESKRIAAEQTALAAGDWRAGKGIGPCQYMD